MGIDLQEGYDAIGSSVQKNQTYKQLSKDYNRLKKIKRTLQVVITKKRKNLISGNKNNLINLMSC